MWSVKAESLEERKSGKQLFISSSVFLNNQIANINNQLQITITISRKGDMFGNNAFLTLFSFGTRIHFGQHEFPKFDFFVKWSNTHWWAQKCDSEAELLIIMKRVGTFRQNIGCSVSTFFGVRNVVFCLAKRRCVYILTNSKRCNTVDMEQVLPPFQKISQLNFRVLQQRA